jgi:hypothetical protein
MTAAGFLFAMALVCNAGSVLHAEEPPAEKWLSGDKRAHFTGGLVIGTVFSSQIGSRHSGQLMGCAVGAVGELVQVPHGGWLSRDVSAKDFVAECAGAILGSYIGVHLASESVVEAASGMRVADPWSSADKRSHFFSGALLSGLVAAHTGSAKGGFLAGCSLGAVGELVDATQYGWNSKHVSARDFAVACLGAWAGAQFSVQIAPDRIVWSKRF